MYLEQIRACSGVNLMCLGLCRLAIKLNVMELNIKAIQYTEQVLLQYIVKYHFQSGSAMMKHLGSHWAAGRSYARTQADLGFHQTAQINLIVGRATAPKNSRDDIMKPAVPLPVTRAEPYGSAIRL